MGAAMQLGQLSRWSLFNGASFCRHHVRRQHSIRGYSSAADPTSAGGVSLIQGASRGLGLEFVRQLLETRPDESVVATCRNPSGAEQLQELARAHSDRLTVLPLDVTAEGSIQEAAKSVKASHGRVDLLVNTAAILHVQGKVQPETALARVTPEAMLLSYQVNAMGPILVAKHFHQLLKAGGGKGTRRPAAVLANMSARVGSIGDNQIGGWHSYRASKTALNQLSKNLAIEFTRRKDPIIVVMLHPGTVDTDLSKPFQRGVPEGKLFSKERAVRQLLDIIDTRQLEDSGHFFAWDKQEIPW
ncbi:NAD(P)-binding Rossmann-fold superfamily protein [Klebsormidium nitens]|uniref:NAD(P)-binding Rossmann-fold superfamily protein n=1 Tax=Klebsormidium nitens TaxID=105231 RepID=A0A1Y1I224_KLENI|nr:NAD(P)-binding Rossmann-fold superfamily protein [Klebsormidium nitens]|eukprot:GAQ84975.1 NAD(P)-binding Rossmann-fold superfamily protein [Klebsormidium nitens]